MSDAVPCDVVVLGGVNSDYVVRGQRLPAMGETLEGDAFLAGPGGKGANQAVAVARLDVKVAFLSRVGADARGEELLASLAKEGVDVRHVARDSQSPTGAAVIMVDDAGRKQIFAAPGAIKQMSVADVQAAATMLRAAKVVLSQLEAPVPVVQEAFRIARDAGKRTVLDTAPPVALPDDLLKLIDVIRCNAAEAAALTGVEVCDAPSAQRAARELMRRGARAAIVEAGEEGNLIVWCAEERLLSRLDVASVDATGAGDAFAATLASFLAEGLSLLDAAMAANAAAALATTKFGAQAGLPRRAELLSFAAASYGAR